MGEDAALGGQLALLVALCSQAWLLPERLGRLPQAHYFQTTLVVGWVRDATVALTLAVWACLAVLGWRRVRWARLEEGSHLRVFVLCITVGLAWAYSAYPLNPYYGEWHLVDRMLLVVLAALVVVHPTFVVPFLLHLRMLTEQFGQIAGPYSFTDKQIAFDVLLVFSAFLLCRLLIRMPVRAFFIMVCAILGAHFVSSAFAKVQLGWWAGERLEFLLTSSYANGWLGGLSRETIAVAADVVTAIAPALKTLVLLSEFSPLVMLWSRSVFLGVMGLLLLLHLGVFAVAGLLFWKWMLVEAGLALFVLRSSAPWVAGLFRPGPYVMATALMVSAQLYFRPAQLAWLDTAITHTYDLLAVGRSGTLYPVARGFMEPFSIVFSQNRFDRLFDGKSTQGTYGATTNRDIARAINALVSTPDTSLAENLRRIEDRLGNNEFSEEGAATFDVFIQRFFRTLNGRGTKGELPFPLLPPRHIWNTAPAGAYRMQEPIREIVVHRQTLAWKPELRRHIRLEDRTLRRVRIE